MDEQTTTVCVPSTESEYVIASEGAKEALWLTRLFKEISPLQFVPNFLIDNASGINEKPRTLSQKVQTY